MRDYLTFQLWGPMAAFGGIAVGEVRPCDASPAKSAVVGILAGALGIPREKDAEHLALSNGYAMAAREDLPGAPLRDFHTVQTPGSAGKLRPTTRREELSGRFGLSTIVSSRDYLCDTAWTICLWARDSAPYCLEDLVEALWYPRWTPYLGRKSCPPGLPFAPCLEKHASFLDALSARKPNREFLKPLDAGTPARVFWEDEDGPEEMSGPRRDATHTRSRWRFAEREERRGFAPMP